ncbi:MAG TPA: phosphoribosylaminoimidazolesuccinocarboxamide synthase [Longimicrobium sp.]|nr:phosphoribosylaminoimidazolesuccinocarboxamide synthase [Longimicrobium sp.]
MGGRPVGQRPREHVASRGRIPGILLRFPLRANDLRENTRKRRKRIAGAERPAWDNSATPQPHFTQRTQRFKREDAEEFQSSSSAALCFPLCSPLRDFQKQFIGCRPARLRVGFRARNPSTQPERQALSDATLVRSDLPFPLAVRGKVRDVYDLGDALLMVATDRVSAFDVVMPDAVPRKGEVLTLLSAWWFARTADLVPNHVLSVDPHAIAERYPALAPCRGAWARRAMLVRRLRPFPVECVVRGYLSGSAWKEYRERGTLAGEPLSAGLRESDRLDPPVFSPATKAETGHDENITFAQLATIVGAPPAARLRDASLALYARGRDVAARAGILLADTKFEFGRDDDGTLRVMDEMMTPDSSRFWPADAYAPGRGQPSLDKQPLRDWLEALCARGEWDKTAPGPALPREVVEETSRRYQDAFRRLTGTALDDFPLHDPGAAA